MNNVPKVNLFGHIETAKANDRVNLPNLNSLEKTEGTSFKGVMGELVQNLNADMSKPDNLLSDLVSGKPNVDIHDVMTAMAKAELGVTIASQITSRVVTAYDRVSQIQI